MTENDIQKITDRVRQHIGRKVGQLTREQCIKALTGAGIKFPVRDTLSALRGAVFVSCCEGTIDVEEI